MLHPELHIMAEYPLPTSRGTNTVKTLTSPCIVRMHRVRITPSFRRYVQIDKVIHPKI